VLCRRGLDAEPPAALSRHARKRGCSRGRRHVLSGDESENAEALRDVIDRDFGPQDESCKLRRDAGDKLARQQGENLLGRRAHQMQYCNRRPWGL